LRGEQALIGVIVTGATGKMGRRVIDLVHADPALALVGAITHTTHAALGRDAGEVAGIGPIGIVLEHDCTRALSQAQVLIDFSVPEAALASLRLAAVHTKAIVVGTTGFTPSQQEEIHHLSQHTPCFVAPNMSVGVSVMLHVLRQLVTLLGPGYDTEILEAHHRTKVDAPSGTALRMAAIIAEAQGNRLDDVAVYGRRGMIGRRSDAEIGIQVIRAGEIVGEHTVLFGGPGERLELVHRSQSRDTFASGAIRAAKWVLQQPCGLYSMEDLLRLA
jgi:4-hydroxy-tetrahydrodipicolinate reductase